MKHIIARESLLSRVDNTGRRSQPRACAVLFLCVSLAVVSQAQTLTTLASFNLTDGEEPGYGALVQGADGNFYGTTEGGGNNFEGTVFKVTPAGTLTALYSFCSQAACADGSDPLAGLIQGSDGNFYGTTFQGGVTGHGTVFKVTPSGTLTALYSFCSQGSAGICDDGENPQAGLVQASNGNFYGTTSSGGANSWGTVFKITLSGALTTLYGFSDGDDGATPRAGLIQASDGNFYGTTEGDLASTFGTVFKITPGGALTTLHTFCFQVSCVDSTTPADGETPYAGLIQASDGNFYGTTPEGGANGGGTIFKITPGGTLTTLYSFSVGIDGGNPYAGVIQATDGSLYGTTFGGGTGPDGTVFKLTLASSTTSPAINQSGGVVNGASFQPGIAPGSWITIDGTNLSLKTATWASAIVNGNLPTSLDGVSVSVGEQTAYIYYISPTQINALAPNVAPGTVPVTVTNAIGTSAPINAIVQAVQPAFFQWGNYAVATTQDFGLAVKNGTFPGVTTVPAKPGEVIILWGAGFGPTSPSAPVGVEVPSSATYNTANTVSVTVGGKPATVYGAALAPGYAGLYQVAIQIPASLANGDYPVIATISDVQSPSTTLITVQN